MSCCSQNLVSRNVPQRVDGGERTTGTMRRYKLVSQLRLACNYSVNLIINMHLFHKVLADVVQQFMQIRVIVINVAGIWRMIVVLLQDGKGDTAVDTQRVDRHEALIAGLLLDYRELTVAEVLRTDAHKVGITLTEVAAQHEHIAHTFQCLYLVPAQFQHLLRAEAVGRLLANLKMIDVADFVGVLEPLCAVPRRPGAEVFNHRPRKGQLDRRTQLVVEVRSEVESELQRGGHPELYSQQDFAHS